mgnify:CR=1 FL=1
MKAIYKREVASYFKSMTGYVFLFFVFLIVGIYFYAYNLLNGYPSMNVTFNSITFVFLLAVPVLTMRVLAEERRQKTDQLLITAPVSVAKIVLGKFFALLTVYLIPIGVICIYPLIMRIFGKISFAQNYTAILGFFLLGAEYCSWVVYIITYGEYDHCGCVDVCCDVFELHYEWIGKLPSEFYVGRNCVSCVGSI